jgi:HEPN domain-containing protein
MKQVVYPSWVGGWWGRECDADLEALREGVAPLDGYYIPTRYPNGLPDGIPARVYTRRAGEDTLRMADQVLGLVREKLEKPRPR